MNGIEHVNLPVEEDVDEILLDIPESSLLSPRTVSPSFESCGASPSSSRERGSKRKIDREPLRASTSEVNEYSTHHTEHPVDIFLASLAPTLKELHPFDLFTAKSEIYSIVQKYELKLLNQKFPNKIIKEDPL